MLKKLLDNYFITNLLLFIVLMGGFYYFVTNSDYFNLKCIVSTVDGTKYCIRERYQSKEAADLLAKVMVKCEKLVNNLYEKYPDNESIQRLHKNFDKSRVVETLPTSELKAYSENKGQKLAFCLNKKEVGPELIDENTLTFVALHELSHLMTKTIGHDATFWRNFKYLIEHAVKLNLYTPEDYKKKSTEYCGLEITDNPYYDL